MLQRTLFRRLAHTDDHDKLANAFKMFRQEVVPRLRQEKELKDLPHGLFAQHITDMWKKLPEARRAYYRKLADEENFKGSRQN